MLSEIRRGCVRAWVTCLVLAVGMAGKLAALETRVQGQLSGSLRGVESEWEASQIALLYLPELGLEQPLGGEHVLDAEISLRALMWAPLDDLQEFEETADLDLYRLWLRHTTEQSELRLGRQHISFGTAYLIRPLMWFDRLDPRDPLQLTEGVDGLMGRYFFLSDANVWLWGLYGNEDPKGWELAPTVKDELEYGGRIQNPMLAGDLAISAHRRRVAAPGPLPDYPETRVGLDGRWDAIIGLWFEGAVAYADTAQTEARYQRLLTVGGDYTFSLGNGVHLLAEQFVGDVARDLDGDGIGATWATALSGDYPIGLMDSAAIFVYADWTHETWSTLARWGHDFATWTLHSIAFWNDGDGAGTPDRSATYNGTGIQFYAVWKH